MLTTQLTRSTVCIPQSRRVPRSPRTDATALDTDQSSERETDLHLREKDGLRHCTQQAIKFRRDLERDEERVDQCDEFGIT